MCRREHLIFNILYLCTHLKTAAHACTGISPQQGFQMFDELSAASQVASKVKDGCHCGRPGRKEGHQSIAFHRKCSFLFIFLIDHMPVWRHLRHLMKKVLFKLHVHEKRQGIADLLSSGVQS